MCSIGDTIMAVVYVINPSETPASTHSADAPLAAVVGSGASIESKTTPAPNPNPNPNPNPTPSPQILCKTELHKIRKCCSVSSDDAAFVQDAYVHFKLLLKSPPKSCRAIMVALYRIENPEQSAADRREVPHQVLAKCLIKKKWLDAFSRLRCDMKVSLESLVDIIPYQSNASATLGLLRVSSHTLCSQRALSHKLLGWTPYAEAAYGLQTSTGPALALEQIFVSRFSCKVAQALLGFTSVERLPLLGKAVALLASAADSEGPIADDTHEGSEQDSSSPDMGAQTFHAHPQSHAHSNSHHERHISTDKRVLRRHVLEKHLSDFVQFASAHQSESAAALNLCPSAMSEDPDGSAAHGSIIGCDVGGAMLRRSPLKGDVRWQYCATNLNLHMLVLEKQSLGDPNLPTHGRGQAHANVNATDAVKSDINPVQYVPFITLGVPAAHGLKFGDGGLRRILHECPDAQSRLRWLIALQSCKGVEPERSSSPHPTDAVSSPSNSDEDKDKDKAKVVVDPVLKEMFTNYPREALSIFGTHATLSTPEGQIAVVRKKIELATRIDMCSSQILGMAVTFVHTICTLAALEGGSYAVVLARSLKIGFLINLQSMLTTHGNEMGMIDDLDCAALWLTLVRVRLVRAAEGQAGAEGGRSAGDVAICRDQDGRFIVDLYLGEQVAAAVTSAVANMQSYVPLRASHVEDAGLFGPEKAGATTESPSMVMLSDGDDTASPPCILATAELFGVAFTQGVNEMQFVANTFVPGEARHQASLNLESITRLERYYARYRHALKYQLYRMEMQEIDGRCSTILPNGDISLNAASGPERELALKSMRVVQRVLDENDR